MMLRTRSSGFTLLEILVVMALLSVVMLAMGAALRTIAQTETRIDSRLARADEFRVAVSFMRTTLGRVSARKSNTPLQAGASPYMFAAAANTVAWVGVMPARFGAGGRYFFRLGLESVGGETALMIRFVPWVDGPAFPDWSRAESRALVTGATAFDIRYADDRANPSQWLPNWPHVDRLPQRMELMVRTTAGMWPALVVPLRVQPAASNEGVFVTGEGKS